MWPNFYFFFSVHSVIIYREARAQWHKFNTAELNKKKSTEIKYFSCTWHNVFTTLKLGTNWHFLSFVAFYIIICIYINYFFLFSDLFLGYSNKSKYTLSFKLGCSSIHDVFKNQEKNVRWWWLTWKWIIDYKMMNLNLGFCTIYIFFLVIIFAFTEFEY